MERIMKTLWCKVMHGRWITGTYKPEFQWVCHKCKRRWKPRPKKPLGIGLWIMVLKLKWTILIKRICG
jgi:hypothetical protein